MPTYPKQALTLNNHFLELMSFPNEAPLEPARPFRCQIWSSKNKCDKMYYSPQCDSYVNMHIVCKDGFKKLCWNEFADHDVLTIPDEKWAQIKSLGSVHLSKSSDDLVKWLSQARYTIVGGHYLGGKTADLAAHFMAALQAGWLPIAWVGDFPSGFMGIFPMLGRSATVPKDWLVSEEADKR